MKFDERMTARFKNQDSRIDQSHLVTLECKDIILRYDEVICNKAQKWEVVEVKKQLAENQSEVIQRYRES